MYKIISTWRYRQYLYSIFATLTTICGGIHGTWTSPFVPLLKSDESPIGVSLTTIQVSFVVSLFYVGLMLGSFLTFKGIDYFGRKKVFVFAGLVDLLVWIVIYFAKSVITLYLARTIAGIDTILCVTCATTYIGELSEKDNRGMLTSFIVIFVIFGNILSYIIGPYTSYGSFAIISACISLFGVICASFIPESPYFLIRNGKHKEAEDVLWKLASNGANLDFIKKRYHEIATSVSFDMANKSTITELLFSGKYKKSLFIHVVLKLLMYFSGNFSIKSFMQTIVNNSGGNISSSLSSVIFGLFNLFAALIAGQIIDRIGRRPLLIVSSLVCSIANFILATYFFVQEKDLFDLDSVSWLPLTSLVFFEVFVALGIISLPYVIASELYPLNIKCIAVSVVTITITPLGAILLWLFEPMNEFWGTYTTFWLFSFCCFLETLFGFFILPETKGKSFTEIQNLFVKERAK